MTVLVPHPEGIPLPITSARSQPFWDAFSRRELLYQRCATCDTAAFDPSVICRHCGSDDLRSELSAGAGSVYSWSTVWRPQVPAFSVPYVAAIVELDEGYHMITNIIGCEIGEVHLGMRVQVDFREIGGGTFLPYFSPIP